MLSGIQHYMFCPRQWALIHIEQQWNENRLTAEGRLIHKNADNPSYRQKNGDTFSLHSVAVSSKTLGLYGFTDVVELLPSDSPENSIAHPSYPNGFWNPVPVEYKHGRTKPDDRDRVQLAAQVICLEEQYGITIEKGFLFYAAANRREAVAMDSELRTLTQRCADEMHTLFQKGSVPKAVKRPGCPNCSLVDVCLPEMGKKASVAKYLKKTLYEETA